MAKFRKPSFSLNFFGRRGKYIIHLVVLLLIIFTSYIVFMKIIKKKEGFTVTISNSPMCQQEGSCGSKVTTCMSTNLPTDIDSIKNCIMNIDPSCNECIISE